MRSSWKYQVLSLAVLAVIGVSRGALADSVALATGNSITTASGLTYTITGCTYLLSGVGQASCGTDNAVLETSGTGRSAIMEVLGATGGSVLSLAAGSNTYSDLTVTLTLKSAAPGVSLTSFTDTLAGTGNAGAPSQVTAAVSSLYGSPSFHLTTSLSNLSDTASFTADNTATAPIYLSVDLKVDTRTGNNGAIALNSVTYRAPEPASIALFGTALTGLIAVRRRFKRPVRKTTVAA